MDKKIFSDNASIITNDIDLDFYDNKVTDNETRSKDNEQQIAVLKTRIDTLENYNTTLNNTVNNISSTITTIQSGAIGNVTTVVNQNSQDVQNLKNEINQMKQNITNVSSSITNITSDAKTYCFDFSIKSKDKVVKDCSAEVGALNLFSKQVNILTLDDDSSSVLYNTYIDASPYCSVGISLDGKSVTIYNFQDYGMTVKLIIQ